MRAAVLTVSDGVAAGTREDRSGDVLAELLAGEGFDVDRAVTTRIPNWRTSGRRCFMSSNSRTIRSRNHSLPPCTMTTPATISQTSRAISP